MKRCPRHRERGSVMVEFALASGVALILMFGVIEMGRALFTYHLVSNAARLGSRYAIVHGSDCTQTLASCTTASSGDIQTYVRSVSPGISANALAVTATWATGSACVGSPFKGAGCTVTVQAQYSFTSVVPLLNFATIPLTSSSQMVISQ